MPANLLMRNEICPFCTKDIDHTSMSLLSVRNLERSVTRFHLFPDMTSVRPLDISLRIMFRYFDGFFVLYAAHNRGVVTMSQVYDRCRCFDFIRFLIAWFGVMVNILHTIDKFIL